MWLWTIVLYCVNQPTSYLPLYVYTYLRPCPPLESPNQLDQPGPSSYVIPEDRITSKLRKLQNIWNKSTSDKNESGLSTGSHGSRWSSTIHSDIKYIRSEIWANNEYLLQANEDKIQNIIRQIMRNKISTKRKKWKYQQCPENYSFKNLPFRRYKQEVTFRKLSSNWISNTLEEIFSAINTSEKIKNTIFPRDGEGI